MKRREFIGGLGGAAAWPLVTRAQQPAMPVIGVLSAQRSGSYVPPAFFQGLGQAGYVEGRNFVIEYRRAEEHYDRLPALAAGLVRSRVAAIIAYGIPSTAAAKAATATIPIVFAGGFDPVAVGFVASLAKPGGNLTGVTTLALELVPKRIAASACAHGNEHRPACRPGQSHQPYRGKARYWRSRVRRLAVASRPNNWAR